LERHTERPVGSQQVLDPTARELEWMHIVSIDGSVGTLDQWECIVLKKDVGEHKWIEMGSKPLGWN